MELATVLHQHHISQGDLCRGAGLSRSVASRIVAHDEWPRRDPAAPARIAEFMAARGVDPTTLKTLFLQHQEKAPDVQQHAEAVPEASVEETQEESMLLRNETLSPAARKHFALARSPFIDDVSTRADVFASSSTRYVRAALMDAALNHGFIALVGESGAGKSTLVEELEERIREEQRPVIVVRPYVLAMEENDAKGKTLKSSQIAEAIARTLDPSVTLKRTPDARFNQMHNMLRESYASGNRHLLLLEEAHCLPFVTMKHLKRFMELKLGLARLLGVCLVGQTELKERLSDRKAEVREVVQRCEIVQMDPLDADLEGYIRLKFERMGIKAADVLGDDVYDALRARLIVVPRGAKATDAFSICYPLVVNNLLTRAMNAAAAAGWPKVDAQVIGGC